MKAVQISVKAGRVGGFLLRALMAALVLFSVRHGETAELKNSLSVIPPWESRKRFASHFFTLHRGVQARGVRLLETSKK